MILRRLILLELALEDENWSNTPETFNDLLFTTIDENNGAINEGRLTEITRPTRVLKKTNEPIFDRVEFASLFLNLLGAFGTDDMVGIEYQFQDKDNNEIQTLDIYLPKDMRENKSRKQHEHLNKKIKRLKTKHHVK